ncbi:MAG: hypothetical protein Sylvanvirus6_34 [Sylvanvirus sp.]|uniref:Uncharacterized protein n=1 Tax=Sylvanvirus sp. TaxID=2487774 RepID=A0A3G5AKD8_9VIRU|nr:MAG: hypothetical protein Sylvanvirus6_34 [Sylvanvirus sp.]
MIMMSSCFLKDSDFLLRDLIDLIEGEEHKPDMNV